MSRLTSYAVVLCLLLGSACASSAAPERYAPSQLRAFQTSTLTIQRQTGRDSFQIWLALTPAQQQQGLMWVSRLPPDRGMLFVLEQTREMPMWMKNTLVPLDMLFFDQTGKITHIAAKAVPKSEAIIPSGGEVAGVLEILAGEAARRGIHPGDRLLHPLIGVTLQN
jgi:uncharacterized protein